MAKLKGIEVTVNMLVALVFVVIVVVILLLLYGSFAAEAGSPVSNVFYKLLDWLANLLS